MLRRLSISVRLVPLPDPDGELAECRQNSPQRVPSVNKAAREVHVGFTQATRAFLALPLYMLEMFVRLCGHF